MKGRTVVTDSDRLTHGPEGNRGHVFKRTIEGQKEL